VLASGEPLAYIASHPGVWLTTSDEIAEHYARTTAPDTLTPSHA
jgi:allantoinase